MNKIMKAAGANLASVFLVPAVILNCLFTVLRKLTDKAVVLVISLIAFIIIATIDGAVGGEGTASSGTVILGIVVLLVVLAILIGIVCTVGSAIVVSIYTAVAAVLDALTEWTGGAVERIMSFCDGTCSEFGKKSKLYCPLYTLFLGIVKAIQFVFRFMFVVSVFAFFVLIAAVFVMAYRKIDSVFGIGLLEYFNLFGLSDRIFTVLYILLGAATAGFIVIRTGKDCAEWAERVVSSGYKPVRTSEPKENNSHPKGKYSSKKTYGGKPKNKGTNSEEGYGHGGISLDDFNYESVKPDFKKYSNVGFDSNGVDVSGRRKDYYIDLNNKMVAKVNEAKNTFRQQNYSSSIHCNRTVFEHCIQAIVEHCLGPKARLSSNGKNNMYENIVFLERTGLIDENMAQIMHKQRMSANTNSHTLEVATKQDASECFERVSKVYDLFRSLVVPYRR